MDKNELKKLKEQEEENNKLIMGLQKKILIYLIGI